MNCPAVTTRPRLSTLQHLGRAGIKRFIYAQLGVVSAANIARGRDAPFLTFRVEASPPSIYLNFALDEAKLASLATQLDLPPGLTLAPLRCLDSDTPRYVITLNVYRVSGLTNGLRAEWSVYVRDDSGKPRYLIVEARASGPSMDPVALVTPAHVVEHGIEGREVRIRVEASSGEFRLRMPAPDATTMTSELIHREWAEANDFIYWLNGVADRVFYNGSLVSAPVLRIPAASVHIEDTTPWRAYIDPSVPVQAVALTGAVDLVISPWCNV